MMTYEMKEEKRKRKKKINIIASLTHTLLDHAYFVV
jgi:hypothetical protein